MKYIREYYSGGIEGVELVPYNEYVDVLNYKMNIPYTNGELDELNKVINLHIGNNNSSFLEDNYNNIIGVSYKYILPIININGFIYNNVKCNIGVYIDKYEDEWFYVKLIFGFMDSQHYKCDQFDSLLKLVRGFNI